MFGRQKAPRNAIDPQTDIRPFRIANPNPDVWVEVPQAFPTADDRSSWTWTTRQAGLFCERHQDIGTNEAGGLFMNFVGEVDDRYPGHQAYWGLVLPDRPGHYKRLPTLIDVRDAQPGSLAAWEQRLVARADESLELHPPGYVEQAAAPARAGEVWAAGLGAGRCVVRRDHHQVIADGIEKVLDAEHVARYENAEYWDESISVQWLFGVAGKDLAVSVRTDDRRLLRSALPQLRQLIDGISAAGGQPAIAPARGQDDLEALVTDAIAGVDAAERRIVDRHRGELGQI